MGRMDRVTSFIVMDLVKKAQRYPDTIHFEIGEPDVPPSPHVTETIVKAARDGKTGYTESMGILPLREKIAEFYDRMYGVRVSPERIIVTVGTSGAFLVAYSILLNAGDRIGMADPSYPCYKNFGYLLGIEPEFIPVDASTRYEITPEALAGHPGLKALHVPSPSNPLGNMYRPESLAALIDACERSGAVFISDEIYHGLTYDAKAHTALEYSDEAIVINGFSKLFGLPGLRIGWMVLPERLMRSAEVVMQNIAISVPTLSQYGAIAAFDYPYLERVAGIYRARRDFLYEGLSRIFTIDAKPEGAFYIWADVSRYADDSFEFAETLLERAHVAATPGADFGTNGTKRYMRFSYTRELDHLREGLARLESLLGVGTEAGASGASDSAGTGGRT
jgi:aspartate/methionine/tyrosine aminotransferase